MLMRTKGCVGILMADSRLEDIVKSGFCSVSHMFTGK